MAAGATTAVLIGGAGWVGLAMAVALLALSWGLACGVEI